MKALFPYLVLISLFVIGTKLVDRQRKYTTSIQSVTPVQPKMFPFQLYLQLAGNLVEDSYQHARSIPDTDQNHVAIKPLSGKAMDVVTTSVKNERSAAFKGIYHTN
ncbi:hypothetical protein G8759_31965 [Spirosoma aureum]|uniref:Uncharacterized protein n=1 Tax=Spirosoma aureum TaxID=2692134 RepID=A0A6G9AWT4_9BACT|nr:hypothetical protein [Spirosoma aureum]QIP16927.1 hypothetical protein G8759_31965 [Spirosoma aureum]